MNTAPEILEIRGLARDFAAAELRPHTEEWDARGAFDDNLIAQLAELGFFGMLVPEADGGMGFDLVTYTAALEELAWGEAGAALLVAQNVIAADLVARHADAASRAAWLPRLADGGASACFVHDDNVRVAAGSASGTARAVVNGARAALAVVSSGDGVYVVQRGGGFSSTTGAVPLGVRTIGVANVIFDGAAAVLATSTAETVTALVSGGTIAVGVAQAALDHAVRYAGEREQFGRPLREFEGIQHKLAEMATRVAAARALVQRAAAAATDEAAAAMAKLTAGTCAMFVTTEAVQVFGGYGYMRDYPVEKLMRDAKALELLHGSNESLRLRIAAALYT